LENVKGETERWIEGLRNSIFLAQVRTGASTETIIGADIKRSTRINFTCKIAKDKVFRLSLSLAQTAIIDLDGRAQLQTSLIQHKRS
jgi:hypothetical protein